MTPSLFFFLHSSTFLPLPLLFLSSSSSSILPLCRSAKDAVLEKNNETFVQTIQDAVINSLEIEKQSCSAYSVWKDQEHHPGAFKRGINKIRASFRSRSRAGSAGGRRRPKLEGQSPVPSLPLPPPPSLQSSPNLPTLPPSLISFPP